MALITTRRVTMQGRSYQAGETVDATGLPLDKIQQLVGYRIIIDTEQQQSSRCIVLRTGMLAGARRTRGEVIDTVALQIPPMKVTQLLEHRILDVAPAAIPPAGQKAAPPARRPARS